MKKVVFKEEELNNLIERVSNWKAHGGLYWRILAETHNQNKRAIVKNIHEWMRNGRVSEDELEGNTILLYKKETVKNHKTIDQSHVPM